MVISIRYGKYIIIALKPRLIIKVLEPATLYSAAHLVTVSRSEIV